MNVPQATSPLPTQRSPARNELEPANSVRCWTELPLDRPYDWPAEAAPESGRLGSLASHSTITISSPAGQLYRSMSKTTLTALITVAIESTCAETVPGPADAFAPALAQSTVNATIAPRNSRFMPLPSRPPVAGGVFLLAVKGRIPVNDLR